MRFSSVFKKVVLPVCTVCSYADLCLSSQRSGLCVYVEEEESSRENKEVHEAGYGFWQGDGKYCGWRCELDEFLTAGIYGADISGQGRRGADVDTVNKSDVHTDGHMHARQWHVHGDVIITLWLCFWEWVSSHLSWQLYLPLLLIYFSEDFKSRSNRVREPAAASELFGCFQRGWMNKKCFRLNPVSSWTLRTEWQTDGAKKCEQCQWAQGWFKGAIQRTQAVKMKRSGPYSQCDPTQYTLL